MRFPLKDACDWSLQRRDRSPVCGSLALWPLPVWSDRGVWAVCSRDQGGTSVSPELVGGKQGRARLRPRLAGVTRRPRSRERRIRVI